MAGFAGPGRPATPSPVEALEARDQPPAPTPQARHRPRARRWITAGCLTLAVLLTPAVQLTTWADGTLLSASGFTAALGTLPRSPAVQAQVTTQLDRRLQPKGARASPLADFAESQLTRAVPAIAGSSAFLSLWRTTLTATYSQLLLVLRGRGNLLTISGSALTVNVRVAASTLINATGLPRQLEARLPASTPVAVTILNNAALGRARSIVRMADILSRVLLPADVALALAGLATARNRRRALLALVIPVAALSALGIRLLTRNAGSPLATAATSALTAPLATDLEITTAICAITAALLLAAPRLPRRLKIVSDPAGATQGRPGAAAATGPGPD